MDLLVTGECKTQKAASERANLHPDYVCRELKKPQIQAFFERRVRETIARGQMRASARLIELLDAQSEHVALDASKHTLALNGIKPADQPQVVNNINVLGGYLIDLAAEPAAPTIDAKANE